MMKLTLIATLLSIMHMANAFAPVNWGIRHKAVLFSGEKEGDSGGGAALAKPKIKQDTKTVSKSKQKYKTTNEAKTHDPISRRDEEFEEAPMFKLMLLSDNSYEAFHVVERMCAIVEDMDEDQASTVFQQASSSGKAMCGMYPFERAELFKEQLIRSDPMIFTDIVKA
jgi:ATP-dependent Clp protease adapter protein ClpS